MSIVQRKILLCKARAQGDPDGGEESYATCLETAGFSCTQLSVLQFKFVNLEELRSLLLRPNAHSGLILTSPRSAEAVGLALEDAGSDLIKSAFNETWEKLPIYCVGPSTDRAARDLLSLQNCHGSETGNAKELAGLILRDAHSGSYIPDGKPLLYPCSAIARDTIVSIVESAGISLRKLPVYQTLPSKTLETDLNEIVGNSPPEFVVFFSPSAVRHVMNAIELNKQDNLLGKIKFVAIGPVTEQAILEAGLKVYATSEQPEPAALSNALKNKSSIS